MAEDPNFLGPNHGPEAEVNAVSTYLTGVADTIRRLSPEHMFAMAAEIEETLCSDGNLSPTTAMTFARMMRTAPELATARAFDCYFDGINTENVVLWEAMDAWEASELPAPQGLQRIRARATKPQTLRRFNMPVPDQDRQTIAETSARSLDSTEFSEVINQLRLATLRAGKEEEED